MGKVLPAARSLRISSSPEILGRPRSMTAISSGYSLPANRPSSPSAATSTVKPCFTSCSRSPSRNAASSSTTSARILLSHPSRGGIDADRHHASVFGKQLEHVDLAAVFVLHVGTHHARAVLRFGATHGLVERDAVMARVFDVMGFKVAAANHGSRHAVCLRERAETCRDQRGGNQPLANLLHGGREFNALRLKGDVGRPPQIKKGGPHQDKQLGHHSAGLTSTRTRMRSPGRYGSWVTWRRP